MFRELNMNQKQQKLVLEGGTTPTLQILRNKQHRFNKMAGRMTDYFKKTKTTLE